MKFRDTFSAEVSTYDEIPSILKRVRAKRGLSTTEVGYLANISQSQYLRIESGQSGYRTQTLENICYALGLILSVKFGLQKEMAKK